MSSDDPFGIGAPMPTAPQQSRVKTFDLHEYTQHKGSVRYNCNIPDAPASSIYVNRATWPRMPKSVRVTIEPIY